MSLEKQIEELQRIVQVLQNDKNIQARVTTVGAFATLAEYKTRIFTEGKASSGAKIGSYDTSPFYASSESLRGLPKGKFNKKGKTGKSKFKSGKSHKSTYLKSGYKEFRSKAGRQNSKVDLNLTGASQQTIQVGTKGDQTVIGFTDPKRMVILEAKERKYGKDIFTLSQQEQAVYQETVDREIQQVIKEIVNR